MAKTQIDLRAIRSKAGRLGALQRYALYGNPGTEEGRRLGGMTSTLKRQQAGEKEGPVDRFIVAKRIREPAFSSELAEFIGVMLGDGCISSPFQAAIYFNARTDLEYADFLEKNIEQLFGVLSRRVIKEGTGEGCLIISSKRLVSSLLRFGMSRGDKVTVQAAVPIWILRRVDYRRACLRGLMDTDGSIYKYAHVVSGRQYIHTALCFTNRSLPLLHFVRDILVEEGYHPVSAQFQVYLHQQSEVQRYMGEIGTHNPKFLRRYSDFLESRPTLSKIS